MRMKMSHKSLYLVTSILVILVGGSILSIGIAASDNNAADDNNEAIVSESTFDINQFKANIQASPDECWKKPAQNRKNAVSNKLTALQQLITEENFEEAYDKLLHDIKPKLTGLKQDEHGDPWGNGVFEKAWVTCEELQVSFEEECNLILSQINPVIILFFISSSIKQI